MHCGLPTSQGLLTQIENLSRNAFLKVKPIGWEFRWKDVPKIRRFHRLFSNNQPVSIDRFLEVYSHDNEIVQTGKELISHIIVSNQNESRSQDNWYKYLLDRILGTGNIDEIRRQINSIKIITFNYDVTIEHFLYRKIDLLIKSRYSGDNQIAREILKNVDHVYGAVYDYEASLSSQIRQLGGAGISPHIKMAYVAVEAFSYYTFGENLGNNIRVNGEDRGLDLEEFKTIKANLSGRNRLFILGFSFDPQNCARIGLDEVDLSNTDVFVTNMGGNEKIEDRIQKHLRGRCRSLRVSNSDVLTTVRDVFDI